MYCVEVGNKQNDAIISKYTTVPIHGSQKCLSKIFAKKIFPATCFSMFSAGGISHNIEEN